MARFLLDTHVLLWSLAEPGRLSARARDALEDAHNEVFVSAVSAWEITVERAKGRLTAPDTALQHPYAESVENDATQRLQDAGGVRAAPPSRR